MPRKYDSPIERVIANTVLAEDSAYNGTRCWLWIGTRKRNREGKEYGTISVRGKDGKVKKMLVHRYVIRHVKGRRLGRGDVGKHLCNNTLCAHPDHLVGGTQVSNVRQCVREGRHFTPFRKAA